MKWWQILIQCLAEIFIISNHTSFSKIAYLKWLSWWWRYQCTLWKCEFLFPLCPHCPTTHAYHVLKTLISTVRRNWPKGTRQVEFTGSLLNSFSVIGPQEFSILWVLYRRDSIAAVSVSRWQVQPFTWLGPGLLISLLLSSPISNSSCIFFH